MNARSVLLPLLVVLGAGALVGLMFFGDSLGGSMEASGEHVGADGEGGDGLGPGGVELASSGNGPHKPHEALEPGTEEAGPKKPTFPASEGVSGRVVDARRRPIADATVTLHPFPLESQWWYGMPDAESVADTKTGKDGTFVIGPAPTGRIKVRAVAPGFAPNVQPLPQRGSRIEIVLDQGGTLDVKVVDGKGAPVADAGVVHTAGTWQTPVVTQAATTKDGVAHFDALPTGSGQLLVSKPGLGAVRQQDVGIALGKTELTVVLQGGRELTGLVTNADDTRPLAGVTVDISYPYVPSLKAPPTVTTNDEGRYRTVIDVGQHEQFELRATRTGFAEARMWLNYNDSGSGSMQHSFKMGQGSAGLTGRVLGPDGGGVSGATVTYANQRMGMQLPTATTDSEGRFDLPAPPGGTPGSWQQVLAMSTADGVAIAQAQLPQKNEARGKPIELRLAGSGNVTGTVKDGAGQPTEGAAVSIFMDWEAMQRKVQAQGGRGMDWMAMQALQDPKVSSRLTAVTDMQGKFAITGVPAGMYQLTAIWGPLQATHAEALDVAARAPAHAYLVLGEGLSIEGVVLDGDDKPVPGAYLWAQPAEQRPGMVQTYPNARAQSDGRFELRNVGAATTYVVYAQATGYGSDQAKGVTPGTRDVTLHLKAMGWIEGQVLVNGEPLVGVFTISANRKSDGRGGSEDNMMEFNGGNMWGGGGRSQLFSAVDGRFVLRGLQGGEYSVTATTPEGLVVVDPPAVTVSEGRGFGPLTLPLLRGAVLKGEVEGVDGKPLANSWLWVYPLKSEEGRNAPSGSSRTDEKGMFLVRGLGSGAYNVNIGGPNAVPWTERVDLQVGEEKQVRFVERQPGRVRITVVDAQGSPIAKAHPSVMDASGNDNGPNWQLLVRDGLVDPKSPNVWERISQTDASGVLLRHHVAPGRYRVNAWLDGFTSPTEAPWIDVASNAVTEVTVTLTPGTRDTRK
jgi:protocatechuate 3,4-dioxygenase beta subunit